MLTAAPGMAMPPGQPGYPGQMPPGQMPPQQMYAAPPQPGYQPGYGM